MTSILKTLLAAALSFLLAACGDEMAPPKPCAAWPVKIAAGVNDAIDFASTVPPEVLDVAYLAPGTYYSPGDLAEAVRAALQAKAALWAPISILFVATVNDAGRLQIQCTDGAAFALKFATGTHAATSARNILGFGSVDTAFASVALAQHQMESCWFATDPVSEDSLDRPVQILRAQTRALSGKVRTRTFATPYERFIALAFLEPHKVFVSEEGTAHVNEALERLFVSGAERFRWFPDASDPATYADYALDAGTKFDPRRLSPGAALYTQSIRLLRYIT